MQHNGLILPTCVSLLKETITQVESLKGRPVPDGHLAKFLKNVESSSTFQGIALNGSLEGKVKHGGGTSKGLRSEIDKAVDLCKQGLTVRFDVLINASELNGSKKQAVYDTKNAVHDMLILNVDAWSSDPKDLVEFGREEIQHLVEWFRPLLQKTGCNIEAVQDQWVIGNLSTDDEMRGRRRPEVEFSHLGVLRMSLFEISSSTLRPQRNFSRKAVLLKT